MIQTKPRVNIRMGIHLLRKVSLPPASRWKGIHLLMEPKQITRPSGMEKSRVRVNTRRLSQNPARSCMVTGRNIESVPS